MIAGRAGWAIFALALALRVGFVLVRWGQVSSTLEFDDERIHWQIATNLVERGALVTDDGRFAVRTPGYPLFLAIFAGLGDSTGVLGARIAQSVIGALGAALVYRWVLAAFFNSRAAAIAGLIVAFDPFNIFFCHLLLTEVLFTTVAVSAAFAAWRIVARSPNSDANPAAEPEQRSTRRGTALGVLVQAAVLGWFGTLVRPSAAGWSMALLLVVLISAASWRAWRVRAGVILISFVVLFGPWAARNLGVLGLAALLGTNGGASLYDGLGPNADGSSRQQDFVAELPELRGLSETQADALLRQRAIAAAQADPARVARLALVKLLRTWNPVPNYGEYRRPLVLAASAAYSLPIYVLAGVGSWLGLRRYRVVCICVGTIAYFTLVHVVYVGSVRYRVPLMPFLVVLAAIAIARMPCRRTKN